MEDLILNFLNQNDIEKDNNKINKLNIAFLIFVDETYYQKYKKNIKSFDKYCKLHNYTNIVHKILPNNIKIFYGHIYHILNELPKYDYIIKYEADMVVVNYNKKIEDYLDDNKLIFTYRIHNGEVAAASYIIKNDKYCYEWLEDWLLLQKDYYLDNASLCYKISKELLNSSNIEKRPNYTTFNSDGDITTTPIKPGYFQKLHQGKLNINENIKILMPFDSYWRCLEYSDDGNTVGRKQGFYTNEIWRYLTGDEIFVHTKDVNMFDINYDNNGIVRKDMIMEDKLKISVDMKNLYYEYGWVKQNNKIIVTLTSIPSRISNLTKTINSLKNQTIKVDNIYIFIPKKYERFDDNNIDEKIPKSILNDDLIKIIKIDKDYGPISKLIPILDLNLDENDIIITVDDDMLYDKFTIEYLINYSNIYSENVIGYCGWNFNLDNNSYEFIYPNRYIDYPRLVKIIEGYRSVLYKKKFIDRDIYSYLNNEIGFYTDDVIISIYLQKKGISKLVIPYKEENNFTSSFNIKHSPDSLSQMTNFHKENFRTLNYYNNNKLWENVDNNFFIKFIGNYLADKNIRVNIKNNNKNKYKYGIILLTFDRPNYLIDTLLSLKRTKMSDTILIIIDDKNPNKNINNKIVKIIDDYDIDLPVIKIYKTKNSGMYNSLKLGYKLLLILGCEYFCNIDSDVILKQDWFNKIINMYNKLEKKYDKNIILTGFNTIRYHKIIEEFEDYYIKNALGGVNMLFHKNLYNNIEDFYTDRLWDYKIVNYMNKNNYKMIAMKESQIQHIGLNGLNSFKNNNDYDFDYSYYEEDDSYIYYPCYKKISENVIDKNEFQVIEYDKNNIIKINKTTILPEIIFIYNSEIFDKKILNNYFNFCKYLKSEIKTFRIIFVSQNIKNYKNNISIFEIIQYNCFTKNPIIYIMDYFSINVISDLDKYKGHKIFEYEDVGYRNTKMIEFINKNNIQNVIYKVSSKDNDIIITNCKNTTFYKINHYINNNNFKNYNLDKEYDIVLYGIYYDSLYPFRKRLYELLIKQNDIKVYYLDHPGYGDDNKNLHQIIDDKLSILLNKAKISIATPSKLDYLVKKYIEIPLSNCALAGNLPKNDGKLFINNIIELDEDMSDSEILNKIKYYLENDDERQKIIDKTNKICYANYTYEIGKQKIESILMEIYNKKIDYYDNDNNKFIKNLYIDLSKENNYYKIISKLNISTPGIKKLFNVKPYQKYIINYSGYIDKNNKEKCHATLWIGDKNSNTIIFDKDDKYRFGEDDKNYEYEYYNKNYDEIYIGILMFQNVNIGNTFYLKDIKIGEMNDINNDQEIRINQIHVSYDISFFKNKFKTKYNLIDYYDRNRSAIFFGLYNQNDYNMIKNHNNIIIMIWGGTDVKMLKEWNKNKLLQYGLQNKLNKYGIPDELYDILTKTNIRHIAISDDIKNSLSQVDIISKKIVLAFVDDKQFSPVKKGEYVYIYTSKIIPESYGKSIYEEIMKKMLDTKFIIATNDSYKDINEIYKKCFIGLRLTDHDGNANTVQELGLCGIKCIHNSDYPNAISWDKNDIDKIIENIEKEKETIGEEDKILADQMVKYLDIGNDTWLKHN